jgi:hypothetical protein
MINGYGRSYKLAAAFVVVEVCSAAGDVSTLAEGSPLPAVLATTLATSILLAGSAAARTRWSWHASWSLRRLSLFARPRISGVVCRSWMVRHDHRIPIEMLQHLGRRR